MEKKNFKVKECGFGEVTVDQLKKFNLIPGNRPIYIEVNGVEKETDTLDLSNTPGAKFKKEGKGKRIGDIIKACYDKETHEWLQREPIVVNTVTNAIGNGQGRSVAFICKVEDGGLPEDSKIPVRYVEVPEEFELVWVNDINNEQHNWTMSDKVTSQIKKGNIEMKLLHEWADTQPICKGQGGNINYRTAANILNGGRTEHNLNNGSYKFPAEKVETANSVCSELQAILDTLPAWTKGKANVEAMAKAWIPERSKFNMQNWLYGVSLNPQGPTGMGIKSAQTWKEYFTLVGGTLAMNGIMPNVKETTIKKGKMASARKKAASAGI